MGACLGETQQESWGVFPLFATRTHHDFGRGRHCKRCSSVLFFAPSGQLICSKTTHTTTIQSQTLGLCTRRLALAYLWRWGGRAGRTACRSPPPTPPSGWCSQRWSRPAPPPGRCSPRGNPWRGSESEKRRFSTRPRRHVDAKRTRDVPIPFFPLPIMIPELEYRQIPSIYHCNY